MMSNFKPNTKLLTTAIFSAMLMLAGCGDNTPAPTDSKPDTSTTNDKPLADSIVVGNTDDPSTFDPQKASDVASFNAIRQMFIGLVGSDKEGKTIPGLATEWSNVDETVWTFKLRDAKWSNGDPITAHDLVYSFRRLTDPKTGADYSSYLADAHVANAKAILEGKAKPETLGVKAIDDTTLEITLDAPIPYFADLLTLPATYPVHQKTVETHGDSWTEPANIVVSGAYTLKESVTGKHVKLERNAQYYDDANNKITHVTLLPFATEEQAERYKAGEIDVTTGVPPEQFQALKTELDEQVQSSHRLCTFYYEYQHQKSPFNDVRVRQALSMTLDRDAVTQGVLGRGELPTYQFTPYTIQGVNKLDPEWVAQDMKTRAETAKRLLNEAGYNESNPLKVEIVHSTNELIAKMTAASIASWKNNLGFVDITANNLDRETISNAIKQGNFQMTFASWCADYNEPSSFLNVYRSNNENNSGKYQNPAFNALLNSTVAKGVTPEQRKELYAQAEKMLQDDAVAAFIYIPVGSRLVKPYVSAETLYDPMGNWQVKDWTIRQK